MRRSEIIQGVNELLAAIKKSKILDTLEAAMSGTSETSSARKAAGPVYAALRDYSVFASTFSPAAKQISEILRLSVFIDDTRLWAAFTEPTRNANKLYDQLRFATAHIPKIIDLLK